MSNFPSWWDSTITIYNKHTDPTTKVTKWYRHSIENQCFWKIAGTKVNVGEVVLDTESTVCRIPKQADFKKSAEWTALPNDEKPNYFTLQPNDIVIDALVEDEIDEYQSGKRSTDIINKYRAQGCITINTVALNTMTGMINPHYYIRGL